MTLGPILIIILMLLPIGTLPRHGRIRAAAAMGRAESPRSS
jgi:hypothetical protein